MIEWIEPKPFALMPDDKGARFCAIAELVVDGEFVPIGIPVAKYGRFMARAVGRDAKEARDRLPEKKRLLLREYRRSLISGVES